MAYREAPEPCCPRCGVELTQYDDRAKWRCKACGGVLLGRSELKHDLDVLVPVGKRTDNPDPSDVGGGATCPACGRSMTQTTVSEVVLDRCGYDGSVWFDSGELGRVRAAGAHQPAKLVQILDGLFGIREP